MIKTTKTISLFLVMIMIFSVPVALESNDAYADSTIRTAGDCTQLKNHINDINNGINPGTYINNNFISITNNFKIDRSIVISTSVAIYGPEPLAGSPNQNPTLTVSNGLEHFYISSGAIEPITVTMSGLNLKGPGTVDNSGNISGGAPYVRNGGVFVRQTAQNVNLNFINMEFKNNVSNGTGAGAVYNSTAGDITMKYSTIDSNYSNANSGAIFSNQGYVNLETCTITNNKSRYPAIYTSYNDIRLYHCTITGNSSQNDEAVYSHGADNKARFNIRFSIIAGNAPDDIDSSLYPDEVPFYSPGTDSVDNLIGWNAAEGFTSMSVFGSNSPKVAYNGGQTETMMLANNSPVIKQGHMALNSYKDQRGEDRGSPAFDIGAIEVKDDDYLTVSLDSNGGSTPSTTSSKYTQNTYYKDLPTLSKTGYTQSGWYTAKSGGTKVVNESRLASTTNHKIYAQWVPNKYKLTFNANAKKVKKLSPKSKAVSFETKIGNLPAPKKSNYNFLGWYTKKKGGSEYTKYTIYKKTGDTKLYAHWTKKKVAKFNANGGQVSKYAKAIKKGKKFGKLPTPKRDGYKFKGWYTKKKGGTKITAKSKVSSSKNYTLYARWKKK